jgi:hypothetical protein
MLAPSNELERQIEAAFDFRGHVTITLNDGGHVVGYVYNRQFADPQRREPPFIEVFLAGSGDRHGIAIDTIRSIALTGKDYAAAEPPSPKTAGAEPTKPAGQ